MQLMQDNIVAQFCTCTCIYMFVAQATLISKAPPRVYSPYFNKFHVTSSNILIFEEVTSFNEIRVVFNRKYYENVQNRYILLLVFLPCCDGEVAGEVSYWRS